ncbi:MAG: flagellar filament capping protein FliD, partial [Planctomycetota bacterium]
MSGPISFGGLASGLDTTAIISALVQAERIPIQQLESQRAQEQSKQNLFGQLDGLLSDLRSKADDLSSSAGFLANTVTPSEEGIASFNATGGALAGSYSLEVLSLASASRFELTPQTSPTADLGGVDISFDIGTAVANSQQYSISLDAGSSSLNDVADAINTQLADVARATVVNTGTDASPSYSLVVESATTGTDNAIVDLDVSAPGGALDVENTLSEASNASILLNGLQIERSTNEFGDVVDGLGITVESLTEADTPITFNVGVDDEAVLASIDEFVEAYNGVISFINTQSEYSEEAGAGGPLFGDPALRQVRSTLSNTLFSDSLIDDTSAFGSLGLLGIDIGTDGTLS